MITLFYLHKNLYASSSNNIPLYIERISFNKLIGITFPVGLFGEHKKNSFMLSFFWNKLFNDSISEENGYLMGSILS
jgi:hypothetical protein